MLGPLDQNQNFLERPTQPLSRLKFLTLSTKLHTFYRMNVFSDSPEGFAFLVPLGSTFSAPEYAQHLS